MPHFLIAPPDDPGWGLKASDFESRLLERWPRAHVRPVRRESNAAVDFRVEIGGDEVDAWLSRDGAALHVVSPATYDQAAELASWWRAQTPEPVRLWLFDTAFRGHTEF